MKKFIVLSAVALCAALLFGFTVSSSSAPGDEPREAASTTAPAVPANSELVGIWQMRISGNLLGMKILDSSGRITNMMIANNMAIITATGRYEVTSGGYYVEHIEKSFTNPNVDGTGVRIKFRVEDEGNTLLTKFGEEDESLVEIWNEAWSRVVMPPAQPRQ